MTLKERAHATVSIEERIKNAVWARGYNVEKVADVIKIASGEALAMIAEEREWCAKIADSM